MLNQVQHDRLGHHYCTKWVFKNCTCHPGLDPGSHQMGAKGEMLTQSQHDIKEKRRISRFWSSAFVIFFHGGIKMPSVLILYYSRTGNTEEMAKSVEEGVKSEGLKAIRKKVPPATPKDLLRVEGIIIGSPTYYGTMAADLKAFLDRSVQFHGKMNYPAASSGVSIGIFLMLSPQAAGDKPPREIRRKGWSCLCLRWRAGKGGKPQSST